MILSILITNTSLGFLILSKQQIQHFGEVGSRKDLNAGGFKFSPHAPTEAPGSLIDRHHRFGVIIGENTVNGELTAFRATMHEHQFAVRHAIALAFMLKRQTDGLHAALAGSQPVSCALPIQVARV